MGLVAGGGVSVGGKVRAFDEGAHHRELYSSNALQAFSGDVPCFTRPEEGLADATFKYAKAVGEGGIGFQNMVSIYDLHHAILMV